MKAVELKKDSAAIDHHCQEVTKAGTSVDYSRLLNVKPLKKYAQGLGKEGL